MSISNVQREAQSKSNLLINEVEKKPSVGTTIVEKEISQNLSPLKKFNAVNSEVKIKKQSAPRRAFDTTAVHPIQITTDKEPAFIDAIKNAMGDDVKHRDSKYMNNRMEQNHRGTKSRTNVMKGFKDSWCTMIFCHTFEEIRQFFYMPNKTTAERRRLFAPKFQEFSKMAYQTA